MKINEHLRSSCAERNINNNSERVMPKQSEFYRIIFIVVIRFVGLPANKLRDTTNEEEREEISLGNHHRKITNYAMRSRQQRARTSKRSERE